MRWFFNVRERISAIWLVIKLSVLLGQFLVWFGVNQYLLGRVFLVSACWLVLALILVANQVLVAHLPNTIEPNLKNLDLSPTQQEKITWKLISAAELDENCAALNTAVKQSPTHQSLLRNAALCLLTQGHISEAQNTWKQARERNPNK